jgi:hypothetical protein
MAAAKKKASAPKPPAPKKPAAKKSGAAATPKPVNRTDKYGDSGFGQTASGLKRQENRRVGTSLNSFFAQTGVKSDLSNMTPAQAKMLGAMIKKAEKRPKKK